MSSVIFRKRGRSMTIKATGKAAKHLFQLLTQDMETKDNDKTSETGSEHTHSC